MTTHAYPFPYPTASPAVAAACDRHGEDCALDLPVKMLGAEPVLHAGDFTVVPNARAQLQQEIADDASVTVLESYARRAKGQPVGVWDVSGADPAERCGDDTLESMEEDMLRAVRYLDMRGMLVRPVAGERHLVKLAARGA